MTTNHFLQESQQKQQHQITRSTEQSQEYNQSHKYNRFTNAVYLMSSIPMVILTWIQFAFNIIVMMSLFYGAWKICMIISSDLDKHVEKQSHLMLVDILQCSKEYIKNKCSLPGLPPAMESICDNWKLCMEQDVNGIIRSKETAVLIAEILNSTFDKLSDRTLYSCATLFIGSIFLTNFMLSWSRIRASR